jgi:hypothetical protein
MNRMSDTELVDRPRGLLVVSAALAAFALYAAIRSNGFMEHFREMFSSFNIKPTPITNFVLSTPGPWWVIAVPALLVFIWIAARSRITLAQRRRMKVALIATIVFSVAVYGLALYALNSPLWAMRSDVY